MYTIVVFYLVVESRLVQPERVLYITTDETPLNECPMVECHSLTALTDGNLLNSIIPDIVIALLPGKHTYSGVSEAGVIEISNATTVELKAVDQSVGATVSCNNSKGIGVALSNISNVMIHDITFESCSTSVSDSEHFTLSISYSNKVTIQNLVLKNGRGIALQIEYLKNALVLTNSTFVHNQANLYIFNDDIENETSNYNINVTVTIENSLFKSGHYADKYNSSTNLSPKVTNPGITIVLNQTRNYAALKLVNTEMYVHPQDIFSTGYCGINHNIHTTSVHIEWLQCNTEYVESVRHLLYGYHAIPGLNIEPVTYSTGVQATDEIYGSITVNNVYFNNSRMQIGPVVRSDEKFKLTLANILIEYTIGPLTIVNIGSVTLYNITIQDNDDGATCISKCKHLSIQGQFTHQRNTAQLLFFYVNTVIFHDNSTILVNYSQQAFPYPEDWPFYIVGTTVMVSKNSIVTIANNVGRKCGGLALEKSNVSFEGELTWLFMNNSGQRGGALVLKKKSKLVSGGSVTNLTFINNHASKVGGAIFVVDSDYITRGFYLGDDVYETFTVGSDIYFYFKNNTANQAGSAIYGGWIAQSLSKFDFGNHVGTDLSLVSSDPTKLCLCSNSTPNCNKTVDSVELIPGDTFSIQVVAVGQRYGVVPSSVLANYLGQTRALLQQLQYYQNVGSKCTKLGIHCAFC